AARGVLRGIPDARLPAARGTRDRQRGRGRPAAHTGVPPVLPRLPGAGPGDVLAALPAFRPRPRGTRDVAINARDLRRQNQAVQRCRTAHRRPSRYRARIARSGTGFGGSGRWSLAGQVEGVGEPALGGWGERDSAGLFALTAQPGGYSVSAMTTSEAA